MLPFNNGHLTILEAHKCQEGVSAFSHNLTHIVSFPKFYWTTPKEDIVVQEFYHILIAECFTEKDDNFRISEGMNYKTEKFKSK